MTNANIGALSLNQQNMITPNISGGPLAAASTQVLPCIAGLTITDGGSGSSKSVTGNA